MQKRTTSKSYLKNQLYLAKVWPWTLKIMGWIFCLYKVEPLSFLPWRFKFSDTKTFHSHSFMISLALVCTVNLVFLMEIYMSSSSSKVMTPISRHIQYSKLYFLSCYSFCWGEGGGWVKVRKIFIYFNSLRCKEHW